MGEPDSCSNQIDLEHDILSAGLAGLGGRGLKLSGHGVVNIVPWDSEAAQAVAMLADIMGLSETGTAFEQDHCLLVVGRKGRVPAHIAPAVVHRLGVSAGADQPWVAALDVAIGLQKYLLNLGGLLLHGGLAEWPDSDGTEDSGRGVIFAGAGGVGKTTTCQRLPPVWRVWCDDATMVLPDGSGGYRAHPWPSWSRFFMAPGECRWETSRSLPLRAVMFLEQHPETALRPLGLAETISRLTTAAFQVSQGVERGADTETRRGNRISQFSNAANLTRAVPAYRLELALHGPFWVLIERILSGPVSAGPGNEQGD